RTDRDGTQPGAPPGECAGNHLGVLADMPDRETVVGLERRGGIVPVTRLLESDLTVLQHRFRPLSTTRDGRVANPGIVAGRREVIRERDVAGPIDGQAREVTVVPRTPVVDGPPLEQGRAPIEISQLIPLHTGHRSPGLRAADRVCTPDGVVEPVRGEIAGVVRFDAIRTRLRAGCDAGREAAQLKCRWWLRIRRDLNRPLPGKGV